MRMIERNLHLYRHGWMVILSGFFEPLFYLLGIGFGLGTLIGTVPGPGGLPISYQIFVAPALLATSSMNGAINETTYNSYFKLNIDKTFTSILTTPISPGDISIGELCWALIRAALYAIGFLAVILLLGLFASPWSISAVPAPCSSASPLGPSAWRRHRSCARPRTSTSSRLVVLPMFLFSGASSRSIPTRRLLQVFVRMTPLYQGVDLIRR